MDAVLIESYRDKLREKRHELTGRVQAIRSEEVSTLRKGAADFVDRASEARSREVLYRLSATEEVLLRRVDEALRRIEEGQYGRCVHCDKEIQQARLEAVPWALHCIECQELQDRGEI